MRLQYFILTLAICPAASFVPYLAKNHVHAEKVSLSSMTGEGWQGEVVQGGAIRGCSIKQVGDSVTDWILTIDGEEADLGKFSEAIYKKVLTDAKQQSFQGFRPGTIPPHLEPTYRAFAMNECAREAVLEAMEQNNLRPFTDARSEMFIENVSIPPPKKKKGNKKKSKRKKDAEVPQEEEPVEEEPKWLTFETMKEAIDAGWKPGQSFSFEAKNLRGQKVLGAQDTKGARPLGLDY